ncbi:MAG TPA: hypothetical protein VJZ71_16700 [Phycisphaerae bacterium]|nr:hypothetical protein [Phycisphaerae bacterium]
MSKSNPATLERALAQVRDLLDQDKPGDAINLIMRFGAKNAEIRNAYGVCLMRLGEFAKALEVYRGLCISQGVSLKPDAPVVHLINYATVLLLLQNVAGCIDILRQIPASSHIGATRVQSAVDRWRRSLRWWQRLGWLGGIEPNVAIHLDYPPGVLA